MIQGLAYRPDWLSAGERAALLAAIDAMDWSTELRRRVQHHGWRYDYRSRRVRANDRLGPLPAAFRPMTERLAADAWFDAVPDQAIVNEYRPGQGIAPHVDCEPCFGATVASVSLGSATVMELRQRSGAGRVALDLAPGSLLVLSGPARYEWTHAIPARRNDMIDGTRRPRGRRVSVTFRTVLDAG